MGLQRSMLLVVLAFFVGLTGWLYSRESLFRLSDVDVESSDPVLGNEIRRKWVELLGRPLFSISLVELERGIKEQFRVERIVIKRKWPTTLSIQITQKIPVLLKLRAGRLWILDKECQEISSMNAAKGLPILKSQAIGSPVVRANSDSICAAIPEIQAHESSLLNWDSIDEIYFDEDRGWSLRAYEKDLEIVLGHRDLFSAWQRATLAMEVLGQKGLHPKFLETSYSKRVVFKLESTLSPKLQNLKDELNYKELVQRAPQKQLWVPAAR